MKGGFTFYINNLSTHSKELKARNRAYLCMVTQKFASKSSTGSNFSPQRPTYNVNVALKKKTETDRRTQELSQDEVDQYNEIFDKGENQLMYEEFQNQIAFHVSRELGFIPHHKQSVGWYVYYKLPKSILERPPWIVYQNSQVHTWTLSNVWIGGPWSMHDLMSGTYRRGLFLYYICTCTFNVYKYKYISIFILVHFTCTSTSICTLLFYALPFVRSVWTEYSVSFKNDKFKL